MDKVQKIEKSLGILRDINESIRSLESVGFISDPVADHFNCLRDAAYELHVTLLLHRMHTALMRHARKA